MKIADKPEFKLYIRSIDSSPVARIETFDDRIIGLAFVSKPSDEIISKLKKLGFVWNPMKGWWDAPIVTRDNMHQLSAIYDEGSTPQLNESARKLFAKFGTEGYFSLFWSTMFWATEHTQLGMRGYSSLFRQMPVKHTHIDMEYIGTFMKWVITAYEADEKLDYESVKACFELMSQNTLK